MHATRFAVIATLAMAGPALIAPALGQETRADRRQLRQQQRIDQGVTSGQLTEKEAEKLERGQEHVQKLEDKALSDGKVTRKEKRKLEHAQDVQSKKIYREKHDRQTR